MARKRYKTKRMDYRKGGRVSLSHGGKPLRRDFPQGKDGSQEWQRANQNWKDDPRHTTTTAATTTADPQLKQFEDERSKRVIEQEELQKK